MKSFSTEVTTINGRPVEMPPDEYSGTDIKTMDDAAARAAIAATTASGDVAVVVVATTSGSTRTFEVEVTHQVTTKIKRVPTRSVSSGRRS